MGNVRSLLRVGIVTAILGHGDTLAGVARTGLPVVDVQEEAKELVVMVRTKSADGEERIGAGIIFGADGEHLFIATANHLVRVPQVAESIEIRFRWLEKPVRAELAKDVDLPMDLAVLSVTGVKGLDIDVDDLPFDRWGDPAHLKRGDAVTSLGNPGGNSWYVPVSDEKFSAVDGNRVLYETNFIDPGHSGGALLYDYTILGMLLYNKPPIGAAISITKLVERLREWRYPVKLGKPRVPTAYEAVSPGPVGSPEDHWLSSHSEVRDAPGDVMKAAACGLATNGAIYCWGGDMPGPRRLPGRLKFKAIAAGLLYACGLTANGTAYCMGYNEDGQLGNGSVANSRVFVPVNEGLTFKSLTAGRSHTCGVTVAGTAYCWGANETGQLGDGSTTNSAVPVAVSGGLVFASLSGSGNRTCGLTTAGAAYCWGSQVGNDDERQLVPARERRVPTLKSLSTAPYETCGVASGGEVYCWAWWPEPQVIKGESPFESVTAGGSVDYKEGEVCALTKKGAAYCWKIELGVYEDPPPSPVKGLHPSPVRGGLVFKQLGIADFYTCGVTSNGVAYCWGANDFGQVGRRPALNDWPVDPVAVSTEP